ncbi:NAD(P)/FAD-dependent oxidoreductase [Nocardia alni]|uniref:NAD(P)/FAD-dependent oxidoreductase n=1 Tax=Nocardia alni TaxID=2815723 RepID=UPI001C2209D5|nr:FAD-dependent oxidoreductase [Nocardia alni]
MTAAGLVDVAVVGAGVIGSSIAHHLQIQQTTTIAFDSIEPARRAHHSASANSGGIIRAVHSRPEETMLTIASSRAYRHIDATLGGAVSYTEAGFAFITDHSHRRAVLDRIALMRSLDYPAELLDAMQLGRRWPEISWRTNDIALFEPASGSIDVSGALTAFQHSLIAHGGEVTPETVTGFAPAADGHWVVTTDDENEYHATTVVIAAGPHTTELLRTTRHHELPATPTRLGVVEIASEHSRGGIPHGLSFIDDITGGYAISRPEITYLGANGRVSPTDSQSTLTDGEQDAIRDTVNIRLPALHAAPTAGTRVGTDATTSDGRPLIEQLEPNLFVCSGFSGGGAKIAPEIGRLTAQWVLTGARPELLSRYAHSQDDAHATPVFSYL